MSCLLLELGAALDRGLAGCGSPGGGRSRSFPWITSS